MEEFAFVIKMLHGNCRNMIYHSSKKPTHSYIMNWFPTIYCFRKTFLVCLISSDIQIVTYAL